MDDDARTGQPPVEPVEPSRTDQLLPGADDPRDEIVREGRRRAAIWGVLTGLAMTVVALGCILLLYLALGR